MKSLIVYFSLTGNTRKMADAIYKGICEMGEKCDIRTLKKVNMQRLPGYDLIGISSPVHYAELRIYSSMDKLAISINLASADI
jgi:menaquinone-dependent protoporphyrinogen IX oxidase